MKRSRPDDDARDNEAASPIALALVDLLSQSSSALYLCLRVCDFFSV
jgi:hypothetical protein